MNIYIYRLINKVNTIYHYKCPSFANNICDSFCDWFLAVHDKDTFMSVVDALRGHKIMYKSNEATLKKTFNKYHLHSLGIVCKQIKHRHAF